MLFIHKISFYSKNCSFTNKIFYYAWMREESTSRNINEENINTILELLLQEKEFLIKNKCFEKFKLSYEIFYVKVVFNILLQSFFYKSSKIKEIKNIIKNSDFNKYLLEFKVIKKLPVKHKIIIFLYKIGYLEIVVKILSIFKFRIY